MSRELKTFEGSVEEKVLRTALKELEIYDFANLVIETCNVLKPVSFVNADVVIQSMYLELSKEKVYCAETLEDLDPDNTNVEYTIVAYDQLFNTERVKELINHGICELREESKPAVLAILKFLRDRKYHQEALSRMKGVGDEAKLTAVMVQHLFSHLIAGNDYVIDNRSKNLPKYCPCEMENCKALIKNGCTALGSPETWHGYADIILNQNIAVSLLECPSKEKNQCIEIGDKFEVENLSDPIQVDKDEEAGPSSPKRTCKGDNDYEEKETQIASQQMSRSSSGVSLCIEVKARNNKSSLANLNVIDQVIAQTITNAFSQVNKTPALSGWLIPTFGCTLDHVIALFYDPKNDVLLQCVDKIPIWGREGLYIPSIVQIWMFLNFTVFTFKDLADDYELNRSNFHCLAKNRLEDYRKMKSGKAFNPTYDCDYYSDVLIRMRKKGKKAHKKLTEH